MLPARPFPTRRPRRRRPLGTLVLAGLACLAAPSARADNASLNFRGLPGLIDMPSAASLADADVSIAVSQFGPAFRTTIGFQLSPRVEAAFRFNSLSGWGGETDSYYNANFDLRYRLVDQNGWVPAVVVGLQDFVGNGLDSGEYIVATQSLGPALAVSAGLGWGRLGSLDALFSMGSRPAPDLENPGRVDLHQYFQGDVAAFGGLEWRIAPKWTAKAEYSSDAYLVEAGEKASFAHESPFNYGLEYRANRALTFGVYSLYGSELGLSVNMVLNARNRIGGPLVMTAPEAVAPRPSRLADPEAWQTDWVATPDAASLIAEAIGNHLKRTGLVVAGVTIAADLVEVRYVNEKLDAEAQAIGRVARAMSQVLPASVETFRIIPVVKGLPGVAVTLRRSDLEALEFSPGNDQALLGRVGFADAFPAGGAPELNFDAKLYPKFTWSLSPFARLRLFSDTAEPSADAGLRAKASYEPAPGLVFSGAVIKTLLGTLNQTTADPSPLPPVRRDVALYDTQGDPAVERLTGAWYAQLAPAVYSRLTFGYIERMFGGVSAEMLWRPVGKPYAFGLEADYVAQRDPDQGFGFDVYDYQVASGFLSAYYDLGRGYHAQLDLGRYLAGDVGGTLTLSREFGNGWRLGAFATLTDASAEDFGDGAFDKGVFLEIPVSWLLGTPTRSQREITLRPYDRDGGARLDVDGRLYDLLHDYDLAGIEAQWARFWR